MRDTVFPMRGENLSIAAFFNQPTGWKESVLGAHCYSVGTVECQVQADMRIPCIHVPMQRLDPGDSICEVWHGSGELTQGQSGAIHYRHDDSVLFGVVVLSETMFEVGADKTPLQLATESSYSQVFELLDILRYPYLLRFWNYIADINTHSFGLERYRQFNLGR